MTSPTQYLALTVGARGWRVGCARCRHGGVVDGPAVILVRARVWRVAGAQHGPVGAAPVLQDEGVNPVVAHERAVMTYRGQELPLQC